jgi:formamidopyrimidine-DNA glycosylase
MIRGMPELPEVETVRRGLGPLIVGRRILGVKVRERRLREAIDPDALAARLSRRRIERVERRAKYLLLRLDGGGALLVHLGMTGRLTLRPAGAPLEPHLHVVFSLDRGVELRFQDPRRFGLVDFVEAGAIDRDRRLSGLGIEPLSAAFTGARLHALARGLRRPVKSFLMDARFVAGVGNIYASEALFLAGVRPQRSVRRVPIDAWERIALCVRKVLRQAIRKGGTSFRDFRDANGDAGYFQVFLRVYDREGEPCRRCGGRVRRAVLGGRSTFYCPRCQR